MRTVYSAVLDHPVRFATQASLWVSSLIELSGVDPSDIRVWATPGAHPRLMRELDRLGCGTGEIAPFHPQLPYCNKIEQLPALAALDGIDAVILCDLDMVFLDDVRSEPPLAFVANGGGVAGRIVHRASPGTREFSALLADDDTRRACHGALDDLRTDRPGMWVPAGQEDSGLTLYSNLNGGLLVFRASDLDDHYASWSPLARLLLRKRDVLGPHAWHAFQISLALSLLARDVPIHALPSRFNHSLSLPRCSGHGELPPSVLHYHRALTWRGRLPARVSGVPVPESERVNTWMSASGTLRSLRRGIGVGTRSSDTWSRAYWQARHMRTYWRSQRPRTQPDGRTVR